MLSDISYSKKLKQLKINEILISKLIKSLSDNNLIITVAFNKIDIKTYRRNNKVDLKVDFFSKVTDDLSISFHRKTNLVIDNKFVYQVSNLLLKNNEVVFLKESEVSKAWGSNTSNKYFLKPFSTEKFLSII